MRLAQVAVAAPLHQLFTYRVPEALDGVLRPGQLVEAPFGRGRRRGVVIERSEGGPPSGVELKDLRPPVEEAPVLDGVLLKVLRWAWDYYLAPPGEMVFAALPPAFHQPGARGGGLEVRWASALAGAEALEALRLRAPLQARVLERLISGGPCEFARLEESLPGARAAVHALTAKGLAAEARVATLRRPPPVDLPHPEAVSCLTPEQTTAFEAIQAALGAGRYASFLLHGVTGSGKTEIYLQAIEQALRSGKGAILLVPEISLTPQLISRVQARLSSQVAVLHSGLSDGERLDEWRRLQRGEARLAVGARSAVFAPVRDLGVIVVDEEHDASYKQSERLPYHGRDMALLRAREAGAVAVLGSATPSLESYAHAESGRHVLLSLPTRVLNRALPAIEVVDLKSELAPESERPHTLGPRLAAALAEVLDRREQAILFLNRRGFSSCALCLDCGQAVGCDRCSVSLVHHRREGRLRCHYCGKAVSLPERCAACGGGRIRLMGLGTEKAEEEVRRRFPGARVVRLDSDVASTRGSLQEVLTAFGRGEADVLVGTQMVTKGHDVPGVTLVGVLLADLGLQWPDFRAAERTFQQLIQVAGRAGRGDRPGQVIVQTLMPQHPVLQLAREQRYLDFVRRELSRREGLGYPPARRLLMVRVSHPEPGAGMDQARRLAAAFRQAGAQRLQVLGPVASPLARLRGRYRFQLLVKAAGPADLLSAAQQVRRRVAPEGAAKFLFDVDPIDML
jgi:primosomal protein N' (replication factor Y)